jgi:hypothetical protein
VRTVVLVLVLVKRESSVAFMEMNIWVRMLSDRYHAGFLHYISGSSDVADREVFIP